MLPRTEIPCDVIHLNRYPHSRYIGRSHKLHKNPPPNLLEYDLPTEQRTEKPLFASDLQKTVGGTNNNQQFRGLCSETLELAREEHGMIINAKQETDFMK